MLESVFFVCLEQEYVRNQEAGLKSKYRIVVDDNTQRWYLA